MKILVKNRLLHLAPLATKKKVLVLVAAYFIPENSAPIYLSCDRKDESFKGGTQNSKCRPCHKQPCTVDHKSSQCYSTRSIGGDYSQPLGENHNVE